ncbi:MAG TPA: hypothetical protein VMJ70_04230 [Candidatus Sulfotelmatobacter sp.]|nr:hypothetical protein [Candidatus Sulfotelmatobacter sp.]
MKRAIGCIATITILLAPAGCSKQEFPTQSQMFTSDSPALLQLMPVPGSATDAVSALQWCFNHRNWGQLETLLPSDYEFIFAPADSAGNAFTGRRLVRDAEITCEEHLFQTGVAHAPPASSIQLVFERDLVALPDPRPGKTYPWHQTVRTQVTLSIQAGDQEYRVLGHALFHAVRGDSAAIPPDLAARGYHADPNRWWIERWEDETGEGPGGATRVESPLPARTATWGSVKALYR